MHPALCSTFWQRWTSRAITWVSMKWLWQASQKWLYNGHCVCHWKGKVHLTFADLVQQSDKNGPKYSNSDRVSNQVWCPCLISSSSIKVRRNCHVTRFSAEKNRHFWNEESKTPKGVPSDTNHSHLCDYGNGALGGLASCCQTITGWLIYQSVPFFYSAHA